LDLIERTARRAVATAPRNFTRRISVRRPAPLACAELNSLRQRKLAREIDRVFGGACTFPAIAATLAAPPSVFAAEAPPISHRSYRIHVRNSAIAPDRAHEFFRFAHVIGEIDEVNPGHAFWIAIASSNRDTSSGKSRSNVRLSRSQTPVSQMRAGFM